MFYAVCRITAWTLRARFQVHDPWDVHWGGPFFVQRIDLSTAPFWEAFRSAAVGAVLLAVTLLAIWRLLGRRWWASAPGPVVAPAEVGIEIYPTTQPVVG